VKVNVAVPADTPVTRPAPVTVATAVLLLSHAPPDVGDNIVVPSTHMELSPVMLTTGRAFIVTSPVVALQCVIPSVKVKVTVPPVTPTTRPALVTLATAVLLLVHVPPEAGDNVVRPPAQMAEFPVMLTIGRAVTFTPSVVALHPVVPSVKVNVAVPADTPVTRPAPVTIATAVLLLSHAPPDVGDNIVVPSAHM
jgi:hypothetical protein